MNAGSHLITTMGWDGLRLAMVFAVLFYMGMVYLTYSAHGPRYRLELNPARPARSTARFAVWLGVRTFVVMAGAAQAFYHTLSEASADVGEWFIRRQGPDAEAKFHSRFL